MDVIIFNCMHFYSIVFKFMTFLLPQIPDCDCKFGARVSGIPVPTAKWYKDGIEIVAGDKYKIKQDGDLVQLQVRNCGDVDKG